jgi:heat shock protein HtpX
MMPATFETLIAQNKRSSILLVIALVAFTMVFIGILGGGMGGTKAIFPAMMFGAVVSLAGSVFSFFAGSTVLTSITSAKQIEHGDDPELFNVVEEMAIAAGVPVPAVYIIDDLSPNAFATGRDPNHALICVTKGLRQKLSRDELQAVIAHEMSHIKNFDIRLMMLVGVFAGMIVMFADFYLRGSSKGSSSDSKEGGWIAIVLIVLALICSLIAPLIANLLKLSVSREREYLADASAVQFCRNPLALVAALRKLTADTDPLEEANRATEHLFIVSPDPKMRLAGGNLDSMWSTHPPIARRIARLEALAGNL